MVVTLAMRHDDCVAALAAQALCVFFLYKILAGAATVWPSLLEAVIVEPRFVWHFTFV